MCQVEYDCMENKHLIPAAEIRHETIVVNSRFIATLAPVTSVDLAKIFILRIREEFPDATHHVPAYLIGYPPSEIAHCSDAGEPSGTAGRPVLAVLRGSGMGNIAVVVTRYFGGTKLGTGGLVRAYTEVVKQTVAMVAKARLITYRRYLLEIPYSLFDQVSRLVEQLPGLITNKDFGAAVLLSIQIEKMDEGLFLINIQELTAGRYVPLFIDEITAPGPI